MELKLEFPLLFVAIEVVVLEVVAVDRVDPVEECCCCFDLLLWLNKGPGATVVEVLVTVVLLFDFELLFRTADDCCCCFGAFACLLLP